MPKLVKSGSASKKSNANENGREVVYEDVSVKLCHGKSAITVEIAKKLLGWQEIEKGEALLTDSNGKRIRCCHNVTNRPLQMSNCFKYRQEILRKRWAGENGTGTTINGEPIIIGRTGLLLNGQHTLIALVLAAQEWENNREMWSEWEDEPVIDKLVVFGISESDDVVNTMDTCKTRTLAEVIFRSVLLQNVTSKSVRYKMSQICDKAIKLIWERARLDNNPHAPKDTHSEAIAFICNHPKLLECVKHIYEEDGSERSISWYLNPGYAAGLLYLMATCKTENGEEYHNSEVPRESMLSWEMWDDACEFWMLLAGKDKKIKPVRDAIIRLSQDGSGSLAAKSGIICKAWIQYANKSPITDKSVALEYHEDDEGNRRLVSKPTVGGIDLGSILETEEVPTPEEVEEAAAEIRQEREDKKSGKSNGRVGKDGKSKQKKSNLPEVEEGMQVWVEEDGGSWSGVVQEIYSGPNGPVAKIKTKTKKVYEAPVDMCLTENPEISHEEDE